MAELWLISLQKNDEFNTVRVIRVWTFQQMIIIIKSDKIELLNLMSSEIM